MKRILILLIVLSFPKLSYAGSTIFVLDWWEFIAKEVTDDLNKHGFDFQIVEYRSNDVALSKILSGNESYDIINVADWVADILNDAGKIDTEIFKDIINSREYIDSIKMDTHNCIPYLWGTTVFSHNSNINKLTSLVEMINLSPQYKIGIIDDKVEFFLRLSLDHEKLGSCLKENNTKQCTRNLNQYLKEIGPDRFGSESFDSSFAESLHSFDAVYGWIGEIARRIESLEGYSFSLPKKSSVFGGDHICAIKNSTRTPERIKEIQEFAKRLTNSKNTQFNVRFTYYFSPYKNFSYELLPKKTRRIYRNIIKKFHQGNVAPIFDYKDIIIKNVGNTWQKIRYD